MIPYGELAAALDRWRTQRGLPISAHTPSAAISVASLLAPAATTTAPPAVVMAPAVAPPPPRTAPPRSPPGTVPPPMRPAPAMAVIDDEVDADMLESADEYDNEGNDFAVAFGGAPAAASGSIGGDNDVDESTHIGALAADPAADDAFGAIETVAVSPTVVPDSAWPEAKEWPSEATSAAAYGWGQAPSASPGVGAAGDDDSTIVGGSNKPRS